MRGRWEYIYIYGTIEEIPIVITGMRGRWEYIYGTIEEIVITGMRGRWEYIYGTIEEIVITGMRGRWEYIYIWDNRRNCNYRDEG